MGFFILLLLIAAGVAIASGIRIVHQQTVGIVETFGKYSRTIGPGLNVILPFGISRIAHTADLRITEKRSMVEVKTKDNAFVQLPASIMFKVNPEKVVDSFYKLDNPAEQISRWVLNSVRSIASQMTLNELFEDREKIRQDVSSELTHKLAEFGYIMETVLIEQPTVSEEVQKASNRVVASQREMEAAKQEGEAARVKIVAAAVAESEAQVRRAEGIAKSRTTLVAGLKQNIEEIAGTGADVKDVMELLATINRLDAMRDVGANGNLVVMDTVNPHLALETKLVNSSLKNAAEKLVK